MGMGVDEIRALAEARNQAIGREYYPHGAGLRESLDLASVLKAHEALNHRDTIQKVMDALHASEDPTERRQLAYLLGDCLEGYVQTAVADQDDAVATAESQAKVLLDGEEIPYRQASSLNITDGDREQRLKTLAARLPVLDRVNAMRRASLSQVYRLIREDLHYPSYTAFYSELKQVDFPAFGKLMAQFLQETEALYRRRLPEWTQEVMGVGPELAHRHDLTFMMRAGKFDPYFPEDRLEATLVATLANLGIDLKAQPNIVLDIEKRPKKALRAFMVAEQVPEKVYLVVPPRGGREDYAAILHESGHAEHFGNTKADLPYEFRWLGDYSVTECFAFTMELLTLDEGWLKQHLAMPDDVIVEYQRYVHTVLFYMLRRYSAKLQFELALHGGEAVDEAGELYREHMERHLHVAHHPALALADVDPGFYCANYLRAWIMWAQLRKKLRQDFGPLWFNQPEAGAFLKRIWSLGQSLPGELLVREFGYEGLDLGPLREELERALGAHPAAVES